EPGHSVRAWLLSESFFAAFRSGKHVARALDSYGRLSAVDAGDCAPVPARVVFVDCAPDLANESRIEPARQRKGPPHSPGPLARRQRGLYLRHHLAQPDRQSVSSQNDQSLIL